MRTERRSLAAMGAIVVAAFVISAYAFATEPATPAAPVTSAAEPSQQSRQQMAAVHEKMAACLRSDKPFAECRTQMQNACHAAMGNQCPMMMGTGMHMRQDPPAQ